MDEQLSSEIQCEKKIGQYLVPPPPPSPPVEVLNKSWTSPGNIRPAGVRYFSTVFLLISEARGKTEMNVGPINYNSTRGLWGLIYIHLFAH